MWGLIIHYQTLTKMWGWRSRTEMSFSRETWRYSSSHSSILYHSIQGRWTSKRHPANNLSDIILKMRKDIMSFYSGTKRNSKSMLINHKLDKMMSDHSSARDKVAQGLRAAYYYFKVWWPKNKDDTLEVELQSQQVPQGVRQSTLYPADWLKSCDWQNCVLEAPEKKCLFS